MQRAICAEATNKQEDISAAYAISAVAARQSGNDLYIVLPTLSMPNYSALAFLKDRTRSLISKRTIRHYDIRVHLRSEATLSKADNPKVLFIVWPSRSFAKNLHDIPFEHIIVVPFLAQDYSFWNDEVCASACTAA